MYLLIHVETGEMDSAGDFVEDESGLDSDSREDSPGEDGPGDDGPDEVGSETDGSGAPGSGGNETTEDGSGMGSGSGEGMFSLFLTNLICLFFYPS